MTRNDEPAARVRGGRLMALLYRGLFAVRCGDGITVTAVMPEEPLPTWDPSVRYTVVNRPAVKVEMRAPPTLPKIIEAGSSGFCGPGY